MIVSVVVYGSDDHQEIDASVWKKMPHSQPSTLWSERFDPEFVRVRWDSSTRAKFSKEDAPWLRQVLELIDENLIVREEQRE